MRETNFVRETYLCTRGTITFHAPEEETLKTRLEYRPDRGQHRLPEEHNKIDLSCIRQQFKNAKEKNI
jgi:hypothetical protein